ncbi:MAG TPA: hypothetical protein VFI09_08870 [Solirubrobacterales bacterium]|nr:hypothetical protein [Solirubrobacterales bacterium]
MSVSKPESIERARPGVTRRGVQIALGLLWLLDGALQFQPYMYSRDFLGEIESLAQMQPALIGHPILWATHFVAPQLAVWNTGFALVQCLIGLGLLYRPTVKPALVVSFAWVLVVWWFGEGLGTVFMDMGAPLSGMGTPLSGDPGAVLLYGLIGALAWPAARPPGRSAIASGPFGDRGGLVVWSALWTVGALIWLQALTRPVYSIHGSLVEAAGDSMSWLAGVQLWLAGALQGDGRAIALALALVSLAIAAPVWTRWRRQALLAGAALSVLYWIVGQSLGGLTTGEATDPNIGPLFILLAAALWPAADERRSADARQVPAAPARA